MEREFSALFPLFCLKEIYFMRIYTNRVTCNPNICSDGIKNAALSSVKNLTIISDQEVSKHINTHLKFLSSISFYTYKFKTVCRIQNVYFIDIIVSPKGCIIDGAINLTEILGLNDIISDNHTTKPYKIYRFRIPVSKKWNHHFRRTS